jgi:hypothetical protein
MIGHVVSDDMNASISSGLRLLHFRRRFFSRRPTGESVRKFNNWAIRAGRRFARASRLYKILGRSEADRSREARAELAAQCRKVISNSRGH